MKRRGQANVRSFALYRPASERRLQKQLRPGGAFEIFRTIVSPVSKAFAAAAGVIRARSFRREVMREMKLTVRNLHPDIIMGGKDRSGWYAEIYLNFGDFRLRITRAIYNSRHQDLWADIGSTSDPAAFFRIDYVMTALRRLDNPDKVQELPGFPDTLPALDAIIWTFHSRLAEHLSAANYRETKRIVQQVMHEDTALAHAE